MKNFVLIGAAGYIAPRHMRAIKETGNRLLAAVDPHDSVGILDQYFPEADFFVEFERFDRHCEMLKRGSTPIDYVVVCSPNYLHDAHIRFGLRLGANVICEKPVVLNPWNAEALLQMEKETGCEVNTLVQLRLHPAMIALKNKVSTSPEKKFNVKLQYFTARGNWYHYSWKGDLHKSGGIATNIGFHLFDLLLWIFGDVIENKVHELNASHASGALHLKHANINWELSIDASRLPNDRSPSVSSYRLIEVDGEKIDLGRNFEDLHTLAYQDILQGRGVKLIDILPTVQLTKAIRSEGSIL